MKLRRPSSAVVDDAASASTAAEGDSRGHSSGSDDEVGGGTGNGSASGTSSVPPSPTLAPSAPPPDCGPYLRGRLSCLMSKVLRHTAESLGLHLGADGFVSVADLLALPPFEEIDVKLCDVECVVEFERREGKKQRFTMRASPRGPEIRANQGHSAAAVSGVQVTRAARDGELPDLVVHGTYLKHMRQILADGLRPMGRHHVHLFVEDGGIGRKGAELLVYVDVAKARAAGVELLISDNGVVLTSGGPHGAIPPACFAKVIRTKDGVELHNSSGVGALRVPAAAYTPPHLRSGAATAQAPKYRPPQRRSTGGAADGRAVRSEPRWAERCR